jgi:hypothetical protein
MVITKPLTDRTAAGTLTIAVFLARVLAITSIAATRAGAIISITVRRLPYIMLYLSLLIGRLNSRANLDSHLFRYRRYCPVRL